MQHDIRKLSILLILLVFVLATRIYPLIRGDITNLETLDTMLVIKQFALGNTHIIFNESWLQVYFVTIPYALLGSFLDIIQTMYVVKATLIIFSALIVYLFGKELGGQRAGYLALLLFAVSPIAIYTQSLGLWTGDAITPIFLAAAILFLLYSKTNLNKKDFYLCGILSIFFLILAYASWNGGIYAIVTYCFVLILLIVQIFIKSQSKVILIGAMLIGAAFLIYIPSPYNIGVFSGGNYAGGIVDTVIQFITNNNYSMYGSGAATNPPDLKINMLYYFLLPVGFLTSFFLIIITLYIFQHKVKEDRKKDAFIAVVVIYIISTVIALSYRRFDSLDIIPTAVLSGTGLDLILEHTETKSTYRYIKFAFAILILIVFAGSILQVIDAQYPTDLTNDYLSTMQWISSSTPQNATFLTNIFDEAPIVYYGNRQSAIDGWNGGAWIIPANASKFDNFLFTQSCNGTYLKSTNADYLIVDRFWLYPGYIEKRNVNGTNMKNLVDGNFQINCGVVTLLLVYESSYNITKIYRIENSTDQAQNIFKELLGTSQADYILMDNFTLNGEPNVLSLRNSTIGGITSGTEDFISKNLSHSLIVYYKSFRNISDVTNAYFSTILELKNSTNINTVDIGTIFNTTYYYINTTENSGSITSAVYGNYLIYFKSVGKPFSSYQAKELIYNQILDFDQNCKAYNTSTNSISISCP